MDRRVIEIPFFTVVEENAWLRLDELILSHYGVSEDIVVAIDPVLYEQKADFLKAQLKSFNNIIFCIVKNSTIEEVENLKTQLAFFDHQVLALGVGGGKTLDVAQAACHALSLPFISVPTTPSHDGIFSPVTVIRSGEKTVSERAKMPLGVVVDLKILRNAPVHLIRSGVGDTLSNLSALKDWKMATKLNFAKYDDYAAMQSKIAYERLIHYKSDNLQSSEFLKLLIESLILSGMAMEIAGSSLPCSGAEHMISHSLDLVCPGNLHGLQVAFGTLVTEVLRGSEIHELIGTFQQYGLPLHLSDLHISRDDFEKSLIGASDTRPGRYSILNEIDDFSEAIEKIALAGLI